MDFTFNVKVSSRAEHKQAVQSSSLFVMYVEVTGRETVERFEVATAVTSGDARGLYVGRRGIFIGSDGRVWDARVVDVVVNPVSMWEAMKLPFLRLEQMFERQVERYSGARYATMEAALDREMATLDKGFQALPAAQAPPPSPAPVPAAPASPAATQASAAERARSARDLVLTGSVAVAALGSSFAFVTKTFSDVKWWYLFATLGALLAVIVVPLAVLAFLKLNRRNLTPLLEASGWAINGRIRVNAAMGSLFTRPTIYPRDAWKQRGDSVEVLAEHIEHRGRTLKYSLSILTFLVAFILGSWISPYLVPEFIVRHMKVVWFFLY
jgi:hypothetical protein